VQIVLKFGSLNLLEPSGPVQACNGIALPSIYIYIYIYIIIYIYIYCAVLKRLTTPSDFHIPLLSTVPFAHSYISSIHGCIYSIFPGSPGTASFFPSFRFPVNHNYLVVALGPFSRHDRNKLVVSRLCHPISYLARPFFL